MRATMESFGLWSNSEGVIKVDWRVEPPLTHIDLLGPTPIDSLDRLQIRIPALEMRSTLAHWNCRGLTWTICQTWDLDPLEMAWPDRRSWNWLTLTHTKRVQFQADSKQSTNAFTVALINARKSYWTAVIQRRFTSIWVRPAEIKVSPSLYERVRIQLPKFKRGWFGPSVKAIAREYNAVHGIQGVTKGKWHWVKVNLSRVKWVVQIQLIPSLSRWVQRCHHRDSRAIR